MRETNKKGQSSFGESIRLLQTGHLPTLSGHGTLPTAGEVYQSQRLIQRFIFFIAGEFLKDGVDYGALKSLAEFYKNQLTGDESALVAEVKRWELF